MTEQEALAALKKILPHPLSFLQEGILLGTWSGKIYREIAGECGYEIDYVRAVGSTLWDELSNSFKQKITKKNLRVVVENHLHSARTVSDRQEPLATKPQPPRFPGGLMPLGSQFYVERPEEAIICAEISRPGSLIRIEAPQQTGKSSLVYRVLSHVKRIGYCTVSLSLHMADRSLFQDLNAFLRWFCSNIALQLNLEPCLNQYWQDAIGSKMSCKAYLQNYVLRHVRQPIVLALDDIDLILQYPALCREFLPLLRSIHEAAPDSKTWSKLRLIVIRSTGTPVPAPMEQSLFEVGLPLYPDELTLEQACNLAQRYELLAEESEINPSVLEMLLCLLGGQPYLIQLAFYQFKHYHLSLHQFMQQATTQSGIYRHHLRGLLTALLLNPNLKQAYQQVITADSGTIDAGVELDAIAAHRLESLGLIRLRGNLAVCRCKLYRQYFGQQLKLV